MDNSKIKKLLHDVKSGKTKIGEAINVLKMLPFEDIGFAKIDTHRSLRCGYPEVIFCKGKTISQITAIVKTLSKNTDYVMATKVQADVYKAIKKIKKKAIYHKEAQIVTVGKNKKDHSKKSISILIISAGTSDIPIAEEAAVTAEFFGYGVERLYDAGVAGIHRLFAYKDKFSLAKVIIVVAGMEGALASIVGGLVDIPVIAVPTSIGYGASFHGLAALLSMLNCCAPGVCVMNIDNGFGAGYFATMLTSRWRESVNDVS